MHRVAVLLGAKVWCGNPLADSISQNDDFLRPFALPSAGLFYGWIIMYQYGRSSRRRLITCHQDMQTLWNEVAKYVNTSILCGHRARAEQDNAFRSGKSTKQWPNSTHNSLPSMGNDAAPYLTSIRNVDYNDHKALARFTKPPMI